MSDPYITNSIHPGKERPVYSDTGPDRRTFIAIDLKSFYASVECVERGLDPLKTNLVVADVSRTEKTICLAVSPSLKSYGISGRARLFEVVQRVREVNSARKRANGGKDFSGKSTHDPDLKKDPSLELDYIAAVPRMRYYMEYSSRIVGIYLRYVAPEDMHVYSIDEVFMDVTHYLKTYKMSAHDLAMKMVREVLAETGITATAGIGTNMFLCKVAMDIVAKHMPADKDGVRVAELDEKKFREILWDHKPLTDFWRIGGGTARKLEKNGMYTLGDVARCSVGAKGRHFNEDLLYKLFGINAELIIDHAWGYEPCEISDIKAYVPKSTSISTGQVLKCPYTAEKGKLIVKEMTEQLSLDLVAKGLVTDQLVLYVGYDIDNFADAERMKDYDGEIVKDYYGRLVPAPAGGSLNLGHFTSSTRTLVTSAAQLYDEIINYNLLIRRVNVVANHTLPEEEGLALNRKETEYVQLDLFSDYETEEKLRADAEKDEYKDRRLQEAVLNIQQKYGKNAILKGMNLEEGAMTAERNGQVGGHKA
ncbi:MAG: DNA methylase [Lachnospiraceae bacterium]|nr:DNA methylase [Lachnospiraceae bacterium]